MATASRSGGEKGGPDAIDRALADLRSEVRVRFPPARRAAGGVRVQRDVLAVVEELRRRLRTLGMRERAAAIDDFGMDWELVERVDPLLARLAERYWRIELRGTEHIPTEGPVLFVANRSGVLPWDGLMLAHALARERSREPRPRFLVADWLVTLPFAQPALTRLGAVRACRENAQRLLETGRSVIAFPEGLKGAGKAFRERYRLKRFGRGGAVRVALETGVPLVPVAVVGAEEVHPVLFRVERFVRPSGLDFLPVTPTFPWLGPLGLLPLPSKWQIRFGRPLATESAGRSSASDALLVSRRTEELRAEIQRMVDAEVRSRAGVFG